MFRFVLIVECGASRRIIGADKTTTKSKRTRDRSVSARHMQAHDTSELSVADVYAPGGPVSLRERNDWMDYGWGRLIDPELGGKVIYNFVCC